MYWCSGLRLVHGCIHVILCVALQKVLRRCTGHDHGAVLLRLCEVLDLLSQVLIKAEDRSNIATSIAVVGRGPYGHQPALVFVVIRHWLEHVLEPLLHQLMCSAYQL
jgi:hypothetical protein